MHAFGNAIKSDIITMYMTNDEQNQITKSVKEFKSKTRSTNSKIEKEQKHNEQCNDPS